MAERQVKSRERVADHGEVFTAQREVNAMLDLVKQETERIDSRFLEPACGDGNFLAEILRRKLEAAKRLSHQTRLNRKTLQRTVLKAIDKPLFEKNAYIAAASIYGVDILQDNVEECRKRLFDIWNEEYTAVCQGECTEECREAVRFILSRNILCGNALTLKQVNAAGEDTEAPIIFSEWVFTGESSVKRSDYRLDALMRDDTDADLRHRQTSLLDTEEDKQEWMLDPESGKAFPKPIKKYPPVYYWKIQNVKKQ